MVKLGLPIEIYIIFALASFCVHNRPKESSVVTHSCKIRLHRQNVISHSGSIVKILEKHFWEIQEK